MSDIDVAHPVPDDFYRAFEERFRGSQDLIATRLQVYRPFLRALRSETEVARGLDLGCGRGEWLQLLESEGFEATGVDLDDGMLQAARDRGLTVENKDAIAALIEAEDASLDVVSGFHIIEHLPFPTRLALVRQAVRVLRPGGLLILETPNPENMLVGTWSFYLDPTHIAPIPPMQMSFLADYVGFARSRILRLNADPVGDDPTLLDVYTKVSLDYALVTYMGGVENEQMDHLFEEKTGLDIFDALNRYDMLLRERIGQEIAAFGARYDEHVQERVQQEIAAFEARYEEHVQERIGQEIAAFEARYDEHVQQRIGQEIAAFEARYDEHVQQRIGQEIAAFEARYDAQQQARFEQEIGALHHHLGHLQKEIDLLQPRPLMQALFFKRTGRPKKLVRRLAFHSNGRPRGGLLRRIAFKKNGNPRPVFAKWMDSPQYAALPWPARKMAVAAAAAAAQAAPPPVPQNSVEGLRGPNPSTHPRRYQVWAQLDASQHSEGT